MAVTVAGKLRVVLDFDERDSAAGVGAAIAAVRHLVDFSASYDAGTDSYEQDKIWSADESVVNGTPDSHDLAGSKTDINGNTITMVEVCGIYIRHKTGTGNLEIGAGANPLLNWILATGDGVKIGPGGVFLITSPANGYAVTAATGDILQVASSSGTVTYEIVIWGRSA